MSGFGLTVEKHVAIPVSDGLQLRANVFRPDAPGRFPVIMTMGSYGKDVHFADGYPMPWKALLEVYPGICDGSSGRWLRWEVADPERWVPDGYVLVVVDSRGSGMSPGYLDPFSPRETQDYHDAIEWAGVQDWSNGKVGLLGISYLSIKQWQVAALQPPHLKAICPWEGCCDIYREWSHHGGILAEQFPTEWIPRQVLPNQHGNAATHHKDRDTGERTTGPAIPEAILAGSRADHPADLLRHPLEDEWYRQRTPRFDRIEVPLLSAGNWGGLGLHLRGNIEGWDRAASKEKWLSIHIGTHFESFYLPRYIEMQKKFFAHYLKDEANGWSDQPPIRLEIRGPHGATERAEQEWPLARTQWTKLYFDAGQRTLSPAAPKAEIEVSYDTQGEGIDFTTAPFASETEFTGPLMARLWVSSSTADLDIFATLRMFDPEGKEVIFTGASEKVPVTRGWLRASHRKLDPALSRPDRPWHAHDEIQKLTPRKVYALDVEIWPTSIVCLPGYRLMLTIAGKDFQFPGLPGRMTHNHPQDRRPEEFHGTGRIVSGPGHESYLLMPLIP